MKKSLFLLVILLMVFCFDTSAGTRTRKRIAITHGGQAPGHMEHFAPADEPDIYFDADDMVIIIEADGFSSYYDVDIYPENSTIPVLWDTVNGTYDTVDVSSLVPDEYRIVITSEYNNEYEGYFIVE